MCCQTIALILKHTAMKQWSKLKVSWRIYVQNYGTPAWKNDASQLWSPRWGLFRSIPLQVALFWILRYSTDPYFSGSDWWGEQAVAVFSNFKHMEHFGKEIVPATSHSCKWLPCTSLPFLPGSISQEFCEPFVANSHRNRSWPCVRPIFRSTFLEMKNNW